MSRALLAALLAYVLINFVLLPGNPFLSVPVYHDDYDNLSYTRVAFDRLTIRPVSTLLLTLLSMSGPVPYYLALHGLTVLCVALVLLFLMRLFELRDMPLLVLLAVALPVYSFEFTVYYYRYTGLITNLLSVTFGVLALLFLLPALRYSGRRTLNFALGSAFFLLTLLSKEDFILPVLLLLFSFAVFPMGASNGRAVPFIVLVAFLALTMLWLWFSVLHVHSHYLASESGTYRPDYSVASVANTFLRYFKATKTTRIVAGLQFAAIFGVLLTHRVPWRTFLLAQAMTFSLLLPYTFLPHHTNPYYCLNWLPWQAGSLLVFVRPLQRPLRGRVRQALACALAMIAMIPVYLTQQDRRGAADWYKARMATTSNILNTLVVNRKALEGRETVGIVGAPDANPWFFTDGSYLANRLGLRCNWRVFVEKDGPYYNNVLSLQGRLRMGAVETCDLRDLPSLSLVPIITFKPDGTGSLSLGPDAHPRRAMASTLTAFPNPITVCDGSGRGVTTLSWSVPVGTVVELREGSPRGALHARTSGAGSVATVPWVLNGTQFYLVDISEGGPARRVDDTGKSDCNSHRQGVHVTERQTRQQTAAGSIAWPSGPRIRTGMGPGAWGRQAGA